MADHIPFVNSAPDVDRLNKYYSDSQIIRVSLETINTIKHKLPKKTTLWIDPAIDGYERMLNTNIKPQKKWEWKKYIEQFPEHMLLSRLSFLNQPDLGLLQIFVNSILDQCMRYGANWISVPQLPIVENSSRNNINRALAKATNTWVTDKKFKGRLILPLIFTHEKQLRGKVQWKPKLQVAQTCYKNANATGVWTVDSSLNDHSGSGRLNTRFAKYIEFHEDLKESLPKENLIITGPHWGINLVLWSKGLCDFPATAMGSAYRYYISGGFKSLPNVRLAITPLRRLSSASPEFKIWLEEALNRISPEDPAFKEFLTLRENYDVLLDRELAKQQIAKAWKEWFNKIAKIQPAGRKLALYQDLSSAYVLGKNLPELPKTEKTARFPDRIAQQLILHCL